MIKEARIEQAVAQADSDTRIFADTAAHQAANSLITSYTHAFGE
jgi:hypothetical protein